MSLFLKLFNTTAEYNAYTADTENFILPNVSCALDDLTTVYYNPCVETKVEAKYNVTSTSSPTRLLYETSNISAMEIDGVAQPSVVSAYTFTTTGVHTVSYTLTDKTTIDYYAFDYCTSLTSIDIPSGVISISDYAFYGCSSLTSITIPNSVTSIGSQAFKSCSSLSSITCNAMTAPSIQSSTFLYVKSGGTLYVPQGSSGYNVWMSTGNYYLGQYGWTKVEQ